MARSQARRDRLSAARGGRGGLSATTAAEMNRARRAAPRGNADEQTLRQSRPRRARSTCANSSRRAASPPGWSRITRCRWSRSNSPFAAARRRIRRARRAPRRCSRACSTRAPAISTTRRSSARSTRRRSRCRSTPSATISAAGCARSTRNLDRAGELLALAINAPRFDEEPFERVREQMNARLRHEANDPGDDGGQGLAPARLRRPSLCPGLRRRGRDPRGDRARRSEGDGAAD